MAKSFLARRRFSSIQCEGLTSTTLQLRQSRKVRERVFLQSTPQGELVIVTLEGEHPKQAFARFGEGISPYTQWFVQQVKGIHGPDLTKPPQGAMPELVVDSQ